MCGERSPATTWATFTRTTGTTQPRSFSRPWDATAFWGLISRVFDSLYRHHIFCSTPCSSMNWGPTENPAGYSFRASPGYKFRLPFPVGPARYTLPCGFATRPYESPTHEVVR